MQKMTYWTSDRIMTLIISLALGTLLILLLRYLSNVLLPFVVACLIAYLLQPLLRFNQRWTRTKGRGVASILTILEVSIVMTGLVFIFMPTIIKDIDMLSDIVSDISAGRRQVPSYLTPMIDFIQKNLNTVELHQILDGTRLETILSRGSSLIEESIDIVMQVLEWLLTLIYVIFILIDYPQICRGFKKIFPAKIRDKAMIVVNDVKSNMNHYFRGQGLVALCAAVFYCTGFSIIGLPLAIPMGILVGILYMIPYFQYVTLIPIAIICFIYSMGGHVEFWTLFGKSILVYVISQLICDYVITPHIMGREMGLNPAMILLSLSVWGSLLGIIGMIIALPATAMIMSYYERYISEPSPSPIAPRPNKAKS